MRTGTSLLAAVVVTVGLGSIHRGSTARPDADDR